MRRPRLGGDEARHKLKLEIIIRVRISLGERKDGNGIAVFSKGGALFFFCHPGERRDPDLQPACSLKVWAPTYVGVTEIMEAFTGMTSCKNRKINSATAC